VFAGGGVDHLYPDCDNCAEEGYTICAPTLGAANYCEAGSGGTTGFNAATVNQPNGPKKLPVTITRITADGRWKLTQTYAEDNADVAGYVAYTLDAFKGGQARTLKFVYEAK
jgi:hypothetical protein